MRMALENHVLRVACPHCGGQTQKTIGGLGENAEIGCPCGTTIHLATDELIPIVEALEGALTRLVRPAPETQRQSD
ncbi:MAG: hypothetical protein WB710_16655 [Stellaceae bacterium]